MYATFNTEQDAQAFTDSVHRYLCDNREGYGEQTEKWSDVKKHHAADLWAVPLPPEPIEGAYSTVENLDGWIAEL